MEATGKISIQELHTIARNLKGKDIKKLDIYSPRLAQILKENYIDYLKNRYVARVDEDQVDPDFEYGILVPFGLNERLYRIDPQLLINSKNKCMIQHFLIEK